MKTGNPLSTLSRPVAADGSADGRLIVGFVLLIAILLVQIFSG